MPLQKSLRLRFDDRVALKFGIARRFQALHGAFRLVHDQYVERGYMDPDPSGLRIGLHHALPSTKVFVARHAARVVGTVTLIADSALGLPMDELYRDELACFRDAGRCITEVSALAIDREYQPSGVIILAKLVRLLILYAIEVARHDDICIAVNPRHVGFYRRLFPDSYPIGEVKAYRKVNGAPATALRIDLRLLRALIPVVQSAAHSSGSAYEFFFRADDFADVVSRLRRDARRSRLTVRQFARLFSGHQALAGAGVREREFIQALYPSVDLARLAGGSLAAPALSFALVPA